MIRAAARGVVLLAALLLSPPPWATADPLRGERVFQRCYACHSVVAGEENLPGPSLRCVLGRQAGALPGFAYSPAMIEAGRRGLVWTRVTLDAFVVDPQGLVPGSAMWIAALAAVEERRDLLDYLEQTGSCPVTPAPAAKP